MEERGYLNAVLQEAEQQAEEFGNDSIELIQHLRDLGYLGALPTISIEVSNPRVKNAIDLFQVELENSSLLTKEQISNFKVLYGDAFAEEVLRKIMDLDEGIPLHQLPEMGATNLGSRIMHYRMKMYGQFEPAVNSPIGFTTSAGIQALKTYFGQSSNLDAVNLLADKESALKRVLSIYGEERCLMFLKLTSQERGELNFKVSKVKSANDFKDQVNRDFADKPRFARAIETDILNSNNSRINWDYIRGRSVDELTSFVVRILQVHQWMDGFYEGKLDGSIGKVSLNSIADLLTFYNAGEDDDLKLKSILYYIGDGYFAFNSLHLIKHYVIEEVPKDNDASVINSLVSQSNRLKDTDQQKFEQNLSSVLSEAKVELFTQKQEAKKGIVKRIYFGIRSFFKKLFKIGKRLVKMILKKFKKVFKTLTSFFKRILEYGKQALKSFIQGLKYFIGRLPIVTEYDQKISITKSQFMGDTLSNIHQLLPIEGIEVHREKVREIQKSAHLSVALIGEILKIMKYMLTGFIGWPLLIVQIARAGKTIFQKHQQIFQT